MADALLRCERTNARLRAALSVPVSDPDYGYLRSWVDRVGACNLDDLVRNNALLGLAAPERASSALALHPFNPRSFCRPARSRSHRLGCSPWPAAFRPLTPRGSSSPLTVSKTSRRGWTRFLRT
eukprot:4064259-Pleurochrysis_carterae.AAC.1